MTDEKRRQRLEGIEVHTIEMDEDGHIIVEGRDFIKDKPVKIILTDAQKESLRKMF